MAGRLAGKTAIVAGAGSSGPGVGNGKATAVLFAREGARVVCADISVDRAQETVDLIHAEGGSASAVGADITKADDCTRLVARAQSEFGGLTILHNNVGIASRTRLRDITEDEWDRVLSVDLKSAMLIARAAVPAIAEAGGGSIVNVSSVAALRTTPLTAYAAAKAGMIGLSISLAGQLASDRIRVNCIAPGLVYTPMVAGGMTAEVRERRRLSALIEDEGTPWDVAWAAVFLASDEARWVTGQTIAIDGGFTVTSRDYAL
ncbi:MAG: SDR family oxidoreductase [Chloroflexota bacterium]|nr:MAG: SDR family oxidoreductase [Chloroflexota bacterium]